MAMNRCINCGRLIGKKEHICKPAWNKGLRGCYKLSDEHKAKIGNSLRGQHYHSDEFKTNLAERNRVMKHNLGKRHKPETIEKMKINNKRAMLGKPSWNRGLFGLYKHTEEWKLKHSGKNHPNWRGGISGLNLRIRATHKYTTWRFEIFKRDNFTCLWCGCNKRLNVDHIKPFAQILSENNIKSLRQAEKCLELWKQDNGRTLCVDCHKKTDTYGRPKKTLDTNKRT